MARLGPRLLTRSISVPYVVVDYSNGGADYERKFELTPDFRQGHPSIGTATLLGAPECSATNAVAKYRLNELMGIGLEISVTQSYAFQSRKAGDHCEPSGALPCARFWPSVKFRVRRLPLATGKFLSFEIIQRSDYTPDGLTTVDQQPFRDMDGTPIHGHTSPTTSMNSNHETSGFAIVDGHRTSDNRCRSSTTDQSCTWDNYHASGRGMVHGPGVLGSAGCADCVHVHWAWTPNTNNSIFGDPGFTDSKPQLHADSKQTALFALVRYHQSEVDPYNKGYESLLNGEHIKGDHAVLFWDASSAGYKNSDGTVSDEIFPVLHTSHPGDSGGVFFAPASWDVTPLAFPGDTSPLSDAIRLRPDWTHLTNVTSGASKGWILPVKVSFPLPDGCDSADACLTAEDPTTIDGPLYIIVVNKTGLQLPGADPAYLAAPLGSPYVTIRRDTFSAASGILKPGAIRTMFQIGDTQTTYLRFASKPTLGKVWLFLVATPSGTDYKPYGGPPIIK